jgi:hypothetical protein
VKARQDALQERSRGHHKDDVIDVQEQVSSGVPLLEYKEGRVRDGGDEAELPEVGDETLVPSPRSLFQTIERVLQKTNIVRATGSMKPRGYWQYTASSR